LASKTAGRTLHPAVGHAPQVIWRTQQIGKLGEKRRFHPYPFANLNGIPDESRSDRRTDLWPYHPGNWV